MNKPMRKMNFMFKNINNLIIDLPAPINLSYLWNFGSILGLCLMIQLITGILLSMHYTANVEMAFNAISHIMRNVNYGWLMRNIHSNGASMFFFMMYLHVGRGIYYGSFNMKETWNVGLMILLSTMATAFMGYVLPWGQMSFWGATVITNLMSAIPYLGNDLVNWIWGGFSVSNATLTRFFSLHFTLPFMILMMVMLHLMFLHKTGSNNPLGLKTELDKIPFHPYFSIKDLLGFSITLLLFSTLVLIFPFMLSDPDNFMSANPMITPIHIQPEWYFLFAYAILRSIPNKLGGVLALFSSILILAILPITNNSKFMGISFYPINQFYFWNYLNTTLLLTWLGSCPVEDPYIKAGMILTMNYFMYFIMNPFISNKWDKIIK